MQILIQQGWGGAEILVSNRPPGEVASPCPRGEWGPQGEEHAQRGGGGRRGGVVEELPGRAPCISGILTFHG